MLRTDNREDPRFAFFNVSEDGRVLHVDFQPGNGTRYETVFTVLPDHDRRGEPRVVISCIAGGNGMCMGLAMGPKSRVLYYTYLQEKLSSGGGRFDLNEADAAAMLLLISLVTDRKVVMPPRFNERADWDTDASEVLVADGKLVPESQAA